MDTCAAERPAFQDVADVAWTFGTSRMAAGRRWTELSKAPCALLASKDGVVSRVDKTAAFRADIARGRTLDDALAALHGATLEWADVPETGATLTWAWRAASREKPKRMKPAKGE